MFLEEVDIRISLMIAFAVQAVRIWFALSSFQSGWISLEVCFITLHKISIVLDFIGAIILDTPQILCLASQSSMSPFPAIFVLENSWVYVHSSLPTLKHLLIKHLAFVLLWASYISTQMISMLDLGDILMTCGLDTRHTSLKICVDLMIDSTMLELMETLVSSII